MVFALDRRILEHGIRACFDPVERISMSDSKIIHGKHHCDFTAPKHIHIRLASIARPIFSNPLDLVIFRDCFAAFQGREHGRTET